MAGLANNLRVASSRVEKLQSGLIVSCQAGADDVIYGPHGMAEMALAAERGGAVGIRANGVADIRAIRAVTNLPIIGIYKQDLPGLGVRITPDLEAAYAISEAGADILAIDCTRRGPEEGRLSAAAFIRLIKEELHLPVMADVAIFEEGVIAAQAGADIVATTLSGYTDYSPARAAPDFALAALHANIGTNAINLPFIGSTGVWLAGLNTIRHGYRIFHCILTDLLAWLEA